MNNQWFLSKNGDVTGPLSLIESQKYVSEHENVYVWQANFVQWQAASQVAEFSDFVKEPEVLPVTPKALVEKFCVKKKRVASKISMCSEKFDQTEAALEQLAAKIASYKEMTAKLSPAVQEAISSTEKRYHVLVNKMTTLTSVVKNAEAELTSVSNEFDNKSEAPVEKKASKVVSIKPAAEEEKQDKESKEESIANALKSAEEEFLAKVTAEAAESTDEAEAFLNKELADVDTQVLTEVKEEPVVADSSEEVLKAELEKINQEIDTEEAQTQSSDKASADAKNAKGVAVLQSEKVLKGANKLLKQVFNSEQSSVVPISKQLKQLSKDEKPAEPVAEVQEEDHVEVERNVKRRRRR